MVSTSGCAKADRVDLVGHLSPVIGVGDEEDTVAELVEWPRLKSSRVEYPTGSSRFREFCKAKSSIDGIWGHAFGYRAQFDYGLTLSLSNLAKSVMNMIGACPAQLNCNFWEVILVWETLNGIWAASGSGRRITAKDFLEYYAVKYVTATDGISCKVSRKESFIDAVAKEGTVLEAVIKELEISRFKRVASEDNKVLLEESDKIVEGADLRPRFEVEAGLLKEQYLANAREKMAAIVDDEFKKFVRALRGVRLGLQDRETLPAEVYKGGEILAFSKGNYEEKEIMDEEEIEDMEDGLNVAEKTTVDNQETIDQEIASSRLRVVDLEGLLEVEKKSSAELQVRSLKADLCRLKGKEAQSRADLAEVQAKNRSLVEELAHACGNVRRTVQHDKEMNERINQLCAQISELERELRVREMKYRKNLKFKLDKKDGKKEELVEMKEFELRVREMKEFLRQKEELVENMSIDLTNSWQKSIDLSRQMSEQIDLLTA
ncbi:hypothetical protein GIB67_005678 [Kingdonia uniflora]|uniref:Uncharacterized protein n=1 Tax=Kingdonia uniflora TaxID=39325 RepID=A0A7J7NIJ8_9MAGN|nr:hypothetical protein GIB67_005678 [Kingdonia uniflora]